MAHPSRSASRSACLRADGILLLVAIIWGSAFSAQRVASAHLGSFLYNGIRFLLGALVLLPLLRGRGHRWTGVPRREWLGGLLAGVLLAAASALQQAGLRYTTAGKAGFITGLYVVLVPLILAIVWRQPPRWPSAVASLLAAAGLYMLSGTGSLALGVGDSLELGGALLWALHVILIDRLAGRVNAMRLAAIQFAACGLISTALGLVWEGDTLGGLSAAWWAILYGGLISVGIGYTLQVVAQRVAPATDAAILMSLESVFAALFGWLTLGETLSGPQMIGCVLMLVGMLVAQISVPARAGPVRQSDIGSTEPV
jgi:drug/metabolite transporter (DMT)-like permease